jgi:hypothetical protein
MWMQNVSCSGGPGTVSIKNELGHTMLNVGFCFWWHPKVKSWIPVRPGHDMLMNYFSCSGGPSVVSIKSVPRYITSNLCICIMWDLWVT